MTLFVTMISLIRVEGHQSRQVEQLVAVIIVVVQTVKVVIPTSGGIVIVV